MDDHTRAIGEVLGTWHTAALGGEPVADGVLSTITFTGESRVEGNGGVNTFGGAFDVVDGQLEFGPLFSTRMAGPEPANRHEHRLLSALTGRRPYTVSGDDLVIGAGDDEIRLRRSTGDAGDGTSRPG